MRFGGPVFVSAKDPVVWAEEHLRLGYSAAYVPTDMDSATSEACAAEAVRRDIVLAEVGAWSNPISPDEAVRKDAIALCCKRLDLADRVGARCCVNIAGSRGAVWDGPDATNLTPQTFDLIVQTVREIIDRIAPSRTFYTLETMPWVFPDSADSYAALIRAIDRKQFAVHLDPVNLINSPARAFRTADILRECFAKLGPWIKSCHAKDIRLANQLTVHLDECPIGQGLMDYEVYLSELSRLPADVPLMLEHLASAEDYCLAASSVRQIAVKAGVTL